MKYNKSATLRFAFKQSLPVLFGYLFLGASRWGFVVFSRLFGRQNRGLCYDSVGKE